MVVRAELLRDPITEPVAAAHATPAFPRTDRYTYTATIGQGGMGVIYRALDRQLEHEVALKVLRARSPDAVARLKAEFRARVDLHHPNLLQLLDLCVTADEAFFTMELVDAVDFLDWVWQAGEAGARPRLAAALAGIASALDALHGAGWVHFDVKPANILVDRTGRALLADFGLSTAIRSRAGGPARDLDGAGTPDYMAPERRRGAIVTPASDLYSLGAVILEALTGSPLDDGGARPRDPLLALARQLMARAPGARPTAAEATAALRGIEPGGEAAPEGTIRAASEAASEATSEPPFVGRAAQLAALEAALARVDPSTAVVAHVHGPSGIGKSMLIGQFLDGVAARRGDPIVLRGRCHPYEQIAFGGVDRIVDGLAERIRDGELSAGGIAPNALAALVRLFPTLPWRVPATAGALGDDDRGLRLLGIATLRELLVRAAAARPLVMWIDDVHWIDDDTEEVLGALAGIPDTMTIYSYRTDAAARAAALGAPPGARGRASVHRVELALGPLDAADLEVLVGAVAPGVAADTRRKLAAAAAGSPVFARVLGRHDAHHRWTAGLDAAGSPAALWNQMIDALPAAQRALFDAIAIAPGPVAASIVRRAVRVDHASPELRALEQLGIVSRAPGRGAIRLAPFHDRLRQVRLEHLDATARARLHRELARSHELVASDDYEALVHHLHALAEDARAGHYAVLAADRASENLAFGAAASYYARAIEWLPERAEPWELHRKLAECEANRGHAESAGAQFELAAAAHRRAAGPRLATTRLSLRAAEQLLHCGRIPEGYRLLREVLEALRVRLPGSHRAAVLASAMLRARLLLRGLGPVPPAARDRLDPEEELRLDALWRGSTSLAHINHALADVLLLRHMRATLDGGSPHRLVQSLTYEAAAEITLGSRLLDRHAAEMLARAERLLAGGTDDYDLGWFEVSCAAIGFFRADFRATIEHAAAAEAHFTRRGIGVAWERAVLCSYLLFALALTGDAATLEARRRVALDDALARRDRLAESYCRSGYTSLTWLFRDEVDAARRERAAMRAAAPGADGAGARPRQWPESGFSTLDYHALLADTHLDLYAGDPGAAHARIEAAWPAIERALLLRIQFVGVDLRFLRARCALAASRRVPAPRPLVRLAARERTRIARDPNPVARPYHALLGGLVAGAPELLDEAARGFDELAMTAHAAAARYRCGELVGGRDGDRLRGEARARLAAAGVARPDRIVEMYAPGDAG